MGLLNLPDETSRREALILQIGILKQLLADSETSWTQYKFDPVPNPVANSLRKQIAEKEEELDRLGLDDVPFSSCSESF